MEELLEQIGNYQENDFFDLKVKLLVSDLKGGDKISIYWSDRENPDYGYVFKLPNQDEDDVFDMCVHVTHVDNSDGMDDAPQEWIHLATLLTLKTLEQITEY